MVAERCVLFLPLMPVESSLSSTASFSARREYNPPNRTRAKGNTPLTNLVDRWMELENHVNSLALPTQFTVAVSLASLANTIASSLGGLDLGAPGQEPWPPRHFVAEDLVS